MCYIKWSYVQKRVNIAGLRCSLKSSCLQGWPLAGIWKLRFEEGSLPLIGECGSLCQTVSTNNVVYSEHPLSSWEHGIWVCAR